MSSANTESDTPRIVAPPPLLYLGALTAAFGVHLVAPMTITHATSWMYVAAIAVLGASAAFARWAFVTMKNVGTSANPRKESITLVVAGPFRHSRNPIYVAMTGLYVGITLLSNSWWPLVALLPLLLTMHWGVVLREERYLVRQFGADYSAYQARTRRWL